MDNFASIRLKLNKNVLKGTSESLLSLFSFEDRLKRMEVLSDAEEGEAVKLVLEGLGETSLKLGNDMEKGQKKSIMTLFWFPEKSQCFEITKDASKADEVMLKIWK